MNFFLRLLLLVLAIGKTCLAIVSHQPELPQQAGNYYCGNFTAPPDDWRILSGQNAAVDMRCIDLRDAANTKAALLLNTLTLDHGGTLAIDFLSNTSRLIDVAGSFSWHGSLVLGIANYDSLPLPIVINFLRYRTGSGGCQQPTDATYEVSVTGKPINLAMQLDSSTFTCTMSLQLSRPEVPATSPSPALVVTGKIFTALLNQDCNVFTANDAKQIVASQSQFNVSRIFFSATCLQPENTSTILTYYCTSSNVSGMIDIDPNRYCQMLTDQINLKGSGLNNALHVTPSITPGDSGSDALYGCLALLALPIFVVAGALIYKTFYYKPPPKHDPSEAPLDPEMAKATAMPVQQIQALPTTTDLAVLHPVTTAPRVDFAGGAIPPQPTSVPTASIFNVPAEAVWPTPTPSTTPISNV